jgi:TolA-binding protein
MRKLFGGLRVSQTAALTALGLVLAGAALPAHGQDVSADARIKRMESEIRALQRKVFPGADGKLFAPEITPAAAGPNAAAEAPAGSQVTDLMARLDSVEAQLKRLTSQGEENANKLAQLETRLPAPPPAPSVAAATAPVLPPAVSPSASTASGVNLAAMTGGASAPRPELSPAAEVTPRPAAPPAPRAAAVATPAAKPGTSAAPSAQRLAAVRAIAKPQTNDPGDDEYSYGYRLWEAKFFPEAQQQLKLSIDRYPKLAKMSFARNLLGRAYLDDGKPREAAVWFLQNYQANKTGERASDSLLYLAEAMRQLKDTNRACIALGEFAANYPRDAAGRLKAQYDLTRTGVKCN